MKGQIQIYHGNIQFFECKCGSKHMIPEQIKKEFGCRWCEIDALKLKKTIHGYIARVYRPSTEVHSHWMFGETQEEAINKLLFWADEKSSKEYEIITYKGEDK